MEAVSGNDEGEGPEPPGSLWLSVDSGQLPAPLHNAPYPGARPICRSHAKLEKADFRPFILNICEPSANRREHLGNSSPREHESLNKKTLCRLARTLSLRQTVQLPQRRCLSKIEKH
jgi:hypothetical protein